MPAAFTCAVSGPSRYGILHLWYSKGKYHLLLIGKPDRLDCSDRHPYSHSLCRIVFYACICHNSNPGCCSDIFQSPKLLYHTDSSCVENVSDCDKVKRVYYDVGIDRKPKAVHGVWKPVRR